MKISNLNKKGRYSTALLLLVLAAGLGLAAAILNLIPWWLGLSLCILPIYHQWLGKAIFECDAEGEAINFKNYSIFKSGKIKTDEFPKYKIVDYKANHFLGKKSIKIYLKSKTEKIVCLRYQTSFISRNQHQALQEEMNQIIKHNQKSV
jgi:hypothetical protein